MLSAAGTRNIQNRVRNSATKKRSTGRSSKKHTSKSNETKEASSSRHGSRRHKHHRHESFKKLDTHGSGGSETERSDSEDSGTATHNHAHRRSRNRSRSPDTHHRSTRSRSRSVKRDKNKLTLSEMKKRSTRSVHLMKKQTSKVMSSGRKRSPSHHKTSVRTRSNVLAKPLPTRSLFKHTERNWFGQKKKKDKVTEDWRTGSRSAPKKSSKKEKKPLQLTNGDEASCKTSRSRRSASRGRSRTLLLTNGEETSCTKSSHRGRSRTLSRGRGASNKVTFSKDNDWHQYTAAVSAI